jgi:hypothetical protein
LTILLVNSFLLKHTQQLLIYGLNTLHVDYQHLPQEKLKEILGNTGAQYVGFGAQYVGCGAQVVGFGAQYVGCCGAQVG